MHDALPHAVGGSRSKVVDGDFDVEEPPFMPVGPGGTRGTSRGNSITLPHSPIPGASGLPFRPRPSRSGRSGFLLVREREAPMRAEVALQGTAVATAQSLGFFDAAARLVPPLLISGVSGGVLCVRIERGEPCGSTHGWRRAWKKASKRGEDLDALCTWSSVAVLVTVPRHVRLGGAATTVLEPSPTLWTPPNG